MSDYGFGSRLLHRLALGSKPIAEVSFELERALMGRGVDFRSDGEHVFVCGLARSGTTVIMRALFQTGAFCSLTYRDMPFVLAPGIWSILSSFRPRNRPATERAHGDRVMVDFDSPEALEEVFWRVFQNGCYIEATKLVPVAADDETIERFRAYVGLVLRRYQASRYLSKNNNNLLRIPSIIKAFPGCRVLCPFRDPAQQAFSLIKQHHRFIKQQAEDPFTRQYMKWLAHHEFGAEHRPFEWGAETNREPDTLDYWIEQWNGAYTHIVKLADEYPNHILLVHYEELCEATETTLARIVEFLGLRSSETPVFDARRAELSTTPAKALLGEAKKTYAALIARTKSY